MVGMLLHYLLQDSTSASAPRVGDLVGCSRPHVVIFDFELAILSL